MKNNLEAIAYAKEYLWRDQIQEKRDKRPASEISLNRALQYRLCDGVDRLLEMFGEVTRKDVAMLVEAWIMAQGNLNPAKPIKDE